MGQDLMRPEDVPADLVEKAAREVTNYLHRSGDWIPPQHYQIARNVLAAVLPEVYEEMQQGCDESYGMGYRAGFEHQSQEPTP